MFGYGKRRIMDRLRRQWGCDPRELPAAYMVRDRIKQIGLYQEGHGGNGVDEITWSDLEMDEVFYRIDHTASFVGEQVLYRQLHETRADAVPEYFDGLVSCFSEDEEKRTDYAYRLSEIGKAQNSYYLPEMLTMIVDRKPARICLYRCLQILLVLAILGAVFFRYFFCNVLLVLIVCINLGLYMVIKTRQEGMFYSLYSICVILRFCRYAEKHWPLADRSVLDQVRSDLALLKKVEQSGGSFAAKKVAAVNDPQWMLADYLWGITLVDLVSYEKVMNAVAGNEEAVLRLFRFTGMIDSAISCASFRESLPFWSAPEFGHEDEILCKEIYHPLIADAVPNDILLGKNTIITGANASGKSTFMKAAAVNVILAQSIHTCAASQFRIPSMDVMSSMAIRDDVILGESYYVREVRYMKRMLERLGTDRSGVDGAGTDRPVLFVIDEVMKGTNQRERLAVSEALLEYFSDRNCLIVAATHDLELVDRLGREYRRCYFDCRYENGTIFFDYKIRAGRGGETNAVKLLQQFHFPAEILTRTREILEEEDVHEDK